jgi:hypothetical protein
VTVNTDAGAATATTNASGQYSVTVPSTADLSVVASHPGEVDTASSGTTDSSGNATANITLPAAAFSGTLTEATSGNAIGVDVPSDVVLTDTTTSATDTTDTDRDGYYAFPAGDYTAADSYTIQYVGPDYANAYYSSGSTTGSSTAAPFTPTTATNNGLNVALSAATGEITGTVTDASGNVDGARVEVFDATDTDSSVSAPVIASSTGSYVVPGLASGSYIVEAIPPVNSADVAEYSGNVGDPYTATPVSVTSPGVSAGNNIKLVAGGTVSGKITNSGGTAVGGVNVDVDDASGNVVYSSQTAADGTYAVTGVAPGTYWVNIDATQTDQQNKTNYASQWFGATSGASNSLEESSASAVTVTSANTTTISQALANGGELTGTIKDAGSSDPLSGDIVVYDAAGSPTEYGDESDVGPTVSAPGVYTIYGLPAGSYYVYFSGDNDWETYSGGTFSAVHDASGYYGTGGPQPSVPTASAVSVSANNTATANVSLPASASIQGIVTSGGNPVSGIAVGLYDAAGNPVPAAAQTGLDGIYEVQGLLPAAYKVGFSAGSNLAFQFYNGVSTLAAATAVTTTTGQITKGINATLSTGGLITGTVTDAATAKVLPDVVVDLLDAQGNLVESAFSRQDGTYTLAGVPTGAYYVEFDPTSFYSSKYQVQYYGGTQVLSGSTGVGVTAGQSTANINAALLAGTAAPKAITNLTVLATPTLTGTTPVISGTLKVGKTLSAGVSGWTAGSAFSYQWYAGTTAIKGATGAKLVLAGAQYKKAITVLVTGSLSGYYSVAKASATSKAVAAGTLKTVVPKVSGTAKVGDKLTAKTGTWTKGTKFTYQWYANKKAIKGATKATFKLAKGEKAKAVTVKVTGKLTGYVTVSKTSKATKKVAG